MQKFILLFLIMMISCYNSSLRSSKKRSPVDRINMRLLDKIKIDTTTWRPEYEKFLSSLDLTLRSKKKIDSIITGNENTLLDLLNEHDSDLNENDTIIFNFSNNGRIIFLGKKSGKKEDTTTLNSINKAISTIALDSIRSEKYMAKAYVIYTSKRLTQVEPILYGSGRSRASIMRVVMRYVKNLRALYNRRLARKSGLKGRIIVKYAINQYGQVVFASVLSSTVGDELLENAVVQQIMHWKFEPVYADGDITEVIYPFVFSQ